MSVSTMTDIAFARRKDVGTPDKGLDNLDRVAEERGQKPETASTASSALAAIAAYIPTEILTVYVAILATFGVTATAEGGTATATAATPLPIYIAFVILSPLVVWALYAAKVRQANKKLPVSVRTWPKWEMAAALIAYAAWAAALPASPLGTFSWFNQAAAGVVALIVSMLLGVFAPVFASNALAGK